MTGSFSLGYWLLASAVGVGLFLGLRRWYAKDAGRAMALLLVMLAIFFAPVIKRIAEMGINGNGFGFFIVFAFLVLPASLVIASNKVRGYEKLGWSLISVFLSWIGFMVFLITHGSRQPTARQG